MTGVALPLAGVLSLACAFHAALAQVQDPPPPVQIAPAPNAPPPAASPQRSAADLETLAAPIALYPDPLIASVVTAAAYPLEIVQAARFVANTNNLPRLDEQPWDNNVKTVARLPEVIRRMNEDLDWTIALGQAFLQQPLDLMNAMQALRARAQSNGVLRSTPQQTVSTTNAIVARSFEGQTLYVTNTVIQIQPASTEILYVPVYNPALFYYDYYPPGVAWVTFGVGWWFGPSWWWGHCDWHYGGFYWGHRPPPPPPWPPPYHPPPGAPPPKPGGRPINAVPPGTRPPISQPPSPLRGPAIDNPTTRWQPDPSRLANGSRTSLTPRDARGWTSPYTHPGPQPSSHSTVTRPPRTPTAPPSATPSPGGSPGRVTPMPPVTPVTPMPPVTPVKPVTPVRPAPSPTPVTPRTPTPVAPRQPTAPVPPSRPPAGYLKPSPATPFSGVGNRGARQESSRGAASRGRPSGGSRGGHGH
ncbi:MAG: hypothetical protein RJA22_2544 [Verrucomicrobiota bacterium]